ncbi:nucleoside hydrolase [Pseudoalteromonas luteoviolacea]|uniref:nucleoside hydrolase n=1 Tax=Pseudoalteromonas luteoviolacea TaxID=43657 RepID=UPI00115396F1|nr:nucleoside hydrolase [Pseudoalteromonas luteoviolacea]TQF71140.1 nucleoside hydrolase [Pseudoalteromonas luteoviolacea]
MKKIIFDTDPGIDDAMALILAHASQDIEVVGITTTFGNASIENTTRNALYLKQKFGMLAEVAQGVDTPLDQVKTEPATLVHGDNGLGNVEIPDQINAPLSPLVAHDYIVETIKKQPGEITLVAVGRLTNLALAIQQAPEIAQLVKEVIIMGGAFGHNGHTGNLTPFAEANVYGDPLAADIVINADWPVTMVGLDVTQQTLMSNAYLEKLRTNSTKYGQFIHDITRFYAKFYNDDLGLDGFYVHDSSAIMYLIAPEIFTTKRGHIRVITEGAAKGHTLFKNSDRVFPIDEWTHKPKQTIAINVESQIFNQRYFDIVCSN